MANALHLGDSLLKNPQVQGEVLIEAQRKVLVCGCRDHKQHVNIERIALSCSEMEGCIPQSQVVSEPGFEPQMTGP